MDEGNREFYGSQDAGEDYYLLATAEKHALPGLKPESAEPGSQARAAGAMLYYGAITGEEEWRRIAGRILAGWTGKSAPFGIIAAPLAEAVNFYSRGPILVKIAGAPKETGQAFLRTSLLSPRPRLITLISKVGTIEGGALEPSVEVCTLETCHLRTGKMGALAGHLGVREKILEGVNGNETSLPG